MGSSPTTGSIKIRDPRGSLIHERSLTKDRSKNIKKLQL